VWLHEDLPKTRPPDADPRLPLDVPFTASQALALGVGPRVLRRLAREGVLRSPFPTVYVDSAAPDDPDVRARAASLVLPPDAVVTDSAAAWLHGVDTQTPGERLVPEPLQVFRQAGHTRMRKRGCRGGERRLPPQDVEHVGGVPVTTRLRTALDQGRLLPRHRAMWALDALLATGGFSKAALLASVERFKGYRGVVQLRELAPLADPGSQSPGESMLRLRWTEAGLPPAETQVPIYDRLPTPRAYVDVGNAQARFGAEYDGEDWHTSTQQRGRDQRRREWLCQGHGWTVVVFTKHDPVETIGSTLRRRLDEHLRRRPVTSVPTRR
jgi:hypothetical protein